MPYLSPPPSTSARSVCLSLNTIQVQITGKLTKQVQQTLLRWAQQLLLRQAQQALPNWPNIYKFATCNLTFYVQLISWGSGVTKLTIFLITTIDKILPIILFKLRN